MADIMGLVKALKNSAVEQYGKGAPYRDALAAALRGDTQGVNQALSKSELTPMDFALMMGVNAVGKTPFELAHIKAQQNAALPISEGGLGLPANNTAMERASALGYATPAYHGTARTPEGISSFDFQKGRIASGNRDGLIGTFSTDNPAVASDFADFAGYMQNSNVMPLMIKQDNPWKPNNYREISDLIDSHTEFKDAKRYPGSTLRMYDDVINSDAARKELMDKGYDSVFLEKTLMDSPDHITPINQYVSIKPENIRSRFAAFDPFRRNEADILAGVGAGLPFVDYNNKK